MLRKCSRNRVFPSALWENARKMLVLPSNFFCLRRMLKKCSGTRPWRMLKNAKKCFDQGGRMLKNAKTNAKKMFWREKCLKNAKKC